MFPSRKWRHYSLAVWEGFVLIPGRVWDGVILEVGLPNCSTKEQRTEKSCGVQKGGRGERGHQTNGTGGGLRNRVKINQEQDFAFGKTGF